MEMVAGMMPQMGAGLYNVVVAMTLAILVALAARSFLRIFVGHKHGLLHVLVRLLVGIGFLLVAWLYFLFTEPLLVWDRWSVGVAAGTMVLVLSATALRHGRRKPPRSGGMIAALMTIIVLLCVLLVAALTVMRAGFVALTSDRVTLRVEVTGETKPEQVRWAPPNRPAREENLIAHHVIFRYPNDRPVGDVWIYGDEVAVKGRVLRLPPMLNAVGIPNLYELLFAHNGYTTAERFNLYPHMAVPLPLTGTLAVHPWLRPLQRRFLEHWTKPTSSGSVWAIKALSDESTYYPLIDSAGKPVRETFLLVLTPGGFSTGRSPSPLDDKPAPAR